MMLATPRVAEAITGRGVGGSCFDAWLVVAVFWLRSRVAGDG
jgi:hypothetical protein